MTREPIAVIGIGRAGAADLSETARAHIDRAEVLAGGRRHLEAFARWAGEKIAIGADVPLVMAQLKKCAATRKTVVLASGDPFFYGIGRALLETFAKDELVFLPHLSSVQRAFARLKETWHDACVISIHGRPLHTLLPALQRGEPKIAILTDGENNPQAIARLLRAAACADRYTLWVCEDLGGSAERISELSLRDPCETSFAPLNVVVLLRTKTASASAALPPLLGIPEAALKHQSEPRGLITKREIRLLSLCHLELRPGDVLWDVGAGSGSVALEAARLSPYLTVHAIEKNDAAFHNLSENLLGFGCTNVHPVHGEAPDALQPLPTPDAVFIGGSGGRLADILAVSFERLRQGGRLVMNCITLESLALGWSWLRELHCEPEVLTVQLAHSRPLGSLHCLEPEHPISILKARKR
jgi:precorrin-6B C5,15-methyltransferase / cobalt-precorrin-6B C5,C15-methyltransferase